MGLELGRRDGRNVRKQEVAKSKGERREGVAAKTHINYEDRVHHWSVPPSVRLLS